MERCILFWTKAAFHTRRLPECGDFIRQKLFKLFSDFFYYDINGKRRCRVVQSLSATSILIEEIL